MTNPNWGLALQPSSFDNALAKGFQIGNVMRQRREEKEYKNALAQYDPNNPETIKPVMQADPRLGIQLRRDAQQQQSQAQEQRRADLPMLGRLLGHAAKGPEQWKQAIGIAQEYGIDTSGVPQQFDPEWAQSQATIIGALGTPEGQEIMSAAGKQAYDEGLRPGDGRFETRVTEIWQQDGAIPYTGSNGETRLYVPGRTGTTGPDPGAQVNGYRFKGGNPNDPNAWERVGGGVSNGTGGF